MHVSSVVEEFKCDRCFGVEYGYPKDKIGVSTLKSLDGSVEGRKAELCAGCVSDLVRWFRAGLKKDLVISPRGIYFEPTTRRLGLP